MATWAAFAHNAPELALLGEQLFEKTGLVLVGTLRKDGYPRISAVEPLIAHGELYLGMIWRSQKGLDLLRDPRCTVHNTVSDRSGTEGEFMVWGRAADIQDADERERYSQALFEKIEWRPDGSFHLFAIDIERAASIMRKGDGSEHDVVTWSA
jgi:hypothetical protein